MADYLFDLVGTSVPTSFWKRLQRRQPALYAHALDYAFSGSTWDRPEAYQVFQSARRANWESEVRTAARECGLKAHNMPHNGGNCGYVLVKAKHLILTFHYVDGPGEFVRSAESRKQHAGVNAWCDEYSDENLFLEKPPILGDGKPIYINVLHGAAFPTAKQADTVPLQKLKAIDPSTCFMRVAIPDSLSSQYVRNWTTLDFVVASFGKEDVQPATAVRVEDKAKPVLKAPKKKVKVRAAGEAE